MSDLKPCPFCGAMPEIIEVFTKRGGIVAVGFQIRCSGGTCYLDGAGASTYGLRDRAIEDWSRRAPRFSPEEREAMESARHYATLKGAKWTVESIDKMLEEK